MHATSRTLGQRIALGTAIAGTLDIVSAFIYAGIAGHGPIAVLQSVAGAILGPAAKQGGIGAALVGLALHFAIMAVMVSVYMLAARRWPALMARPVLTGAAYGLGLWLVMYLIVLPLRWPTLFPTHDPVTIAEQLFSHIVLVGITIGSVASRTSERA